MFHPEALARVQQQIQPYGAQLIAVSKMRDLADIQALYEAGQRVMAENRVQDLLARYEALPKDIAWHLIGHLQTNKVKYIAPFITCIHSVDSLKLLQEIDKQAAKCDRVIACLLQFHVAQEESKFGLSWEEALALLEDPIYASLRHIRIEGIMGMASLTDNEEQIRGEFRQLRIYFEDLRERYFRGQAHFCQLSMGMSSDYLLALEEGATMVRVGSLLFA